jgi:hypothetical protein
MWGISWQNLMMLMHEIPGESEEMKGSLSSSTDYLHLFGGFTEYGKE